MRLTVLTSAILIAGFSSAAFSMDPPAAPAIYDSSRISPQNSTVNMHSAEKAAYALYEAVMLTAEASIHAHGCRSSAGSYEIDIFSNGLVASDPDENNAITLYSSDASITIKAEFRDKVDYNGQQIFLAQVGNGKLGSTAISMFEGVAVYNHDNNMFSQHSRVKVMGSRGRLDHYQGNVIKDFFHSDESSAIIDWGLQSLSKLGYSVNKYWQRSKSQGDNGNIGRTVFVKDRLVGPASCRILIDTNGFNNEDFFWQDGSLVISTVDPGEPVTQFSESPF